MDPAERVPVVPSEYLPPAELYQRGQQLGEATPTSVHADHPVVGPARPGVVEFVEQTHAARLPELLPLRMERMASTPYAFFRGAAGLMAADLADSPTSGLVAQLCGDAHAANFGLYGTPDGEVVIDINDFDETVPGPWEWDLKRLATSLVLAGRVGGVKEKRCLDAAEDAVKAYRRTVRHLAELPHLQAWTALADEGVLSRHRADDLSDEFDEAIDKARRNTSDRVVDKAVEHIDDHETGVRHSHFVEDPPVLWHLDDTVERAVMEGVQAYVPTLRESRHRLLERYSMADAAFRVVGTGSVGMRSYVVLLDGNQDERLVLHVKQAAASSLAPYLPDLPDHAHHGERIVRGARQVQVATDLLLGWTSIEGRDFIVRQFRNLKGGLDPTSMSGKKLDDYGRLCGALLARAHSRSLRPRLLAGYLDGDKELDEAIGQYAVAYADQTERDHADLVAAIEDGRLPGK